MEVWSFDQSSHEDQSSAPIEPVKDLIYGTTVPDIEDPIVLVQQSTDDAVRQDLLTLVWEVEIVLHRPRIRMPDPSIYVHSVLLVSPAKSNSLDEEGLLEPFKPTESNLLEPMQQLPGLQGKTPYLAASRLQRVMPPVPKPSKHLRVEQISPKYRIVPAAIARMRYTRVNTSAATPETIASLDVEMIPFVEVRATIEEVDMQIANGRIENLMPGFLPMECHSKDLITFLYRLQPAADSNTLATPTTPNSLPNLDVLTIAVRIRLKTSDGCQSVVHMDWTTNVDFFQALNPTFGAPSQPLQRTHRPQTLSLGNSVTQQPRTINTSLQPALSTIDAENVVISFTSPAEAVEVGKPFLWQVLVVNRMPRQAKLTIVPLPRIQKVAPATSHFQKKACPQIIHRFVSPY